MRVPNISAHVEPFLRGLFGRLGSLTARAPLFTVISVAVLLVALSIGNWKIEKEIHVNDLLIARRGRIAGEKDFYSENFDLITPVLNSVIITPKRGVNILSVEALDEVHALQESIRTFTFEYIPGLNVSLEQFCFKTINADPSEPCWQSSLLESFREGDVFNVGGELNTDYAVLYAAKSSYKDFDFERQFSRSFLARTNSLNPDSLLLGGFEVDASGDLITSVEALQIAFGAKSPEVLKEDGLQYFEWIPRDSSDAAGGFCPDVTQCDACADALQPTQFAADGCTFDGAATQSASCCTALEDVRNSPCIETVFQRRPEVPPIANPLFTACDLDIVEIAPRCSNQELIVSTNAASGPPAVCICLQGSSDACTAAAGEFLPENPQYIDTFTNAASGEEAAIAELAQVLVGDIGCPVDPPVEPICSCLEDVTGETCTTAVGAFLEENPEQAELFTNAGTGDEDAAQEVGAFLVSEFDCSLPEQPATTTTEELNAAQQPVTTTEAPQLYSTKVTIIKSETDSVDKARKVTTAWEHAWKEQIADVVRKYEYIDVVWLTSTSIDDEVNTAADAEVELFVLGYCLILAYIMAFVTFDWKLSGIRLASHPPGPSISALCFVVMLLTVAAAMGIAGYVSSVSSFKVTFSTVQMLPLLMMGLGVNDFFVLVSSLKTVLTRDAAPTTVADIMYDMMALGGTSVTLSSLANIAGFALGTLSPVPIVLWFSVQMAVGVTLSYIVSVTAIPALVSYSVRRYVDGKQDFIISLFNIRPTAPPPKSDPTPTEESKEQQEGVIAKTIRRFYWPIAAGIVAVIAVWVAMGVRYMVDFEQGAEVSESVRKNSYSHDFLLASEKYFDTSQLNIVFRETVDYSDPADFQVVRRSEFEYVDEGYRVERQLMTSSWMEFYTQYVEEKFCSNEICMNEVNWYYDGFSTAEFGHPTKNICAGVETADACREMCTSHCPQGPEGSPYRCQYVEAVTACYCPYRPMLKSRFFYENPDGFDSKIASYWSDFLTNTVQGRASRIFVHLDSETVTEKNLIGKPKATRSYVFARGLQAVPRQLDHIKKGREILDRQPIDVYPFDYLVYAVGEQYEDLPLRTVEAVGISLAIATVVMMPLVASLWTALIVSFCVALAVLLAVGTSSWTVINLDYASYVAFIVAVGLSVEFCSHIARAFMLSAGDRLTRALTALRSMGVAVMNGGITTFLGILPSAISDLPPIRDRLFVQFSIIVLAGLFIGLLFLPMVLSLVGPPTFTNFQIHQTKGTGNEEKKDTKEINMV